VKWQEGVPYIKDSNSQLAVFSTGKSFWDESPVEGGITIDEDAPSGIKIHASLTASGEGFSIEGGGKEVDILGSIQAANINSENNTLKVFFDDRALEESSSFSNAPLTAKPVLFVSFFRVEEWKEFS